MAQIPLTRRDNGRKIETKVGDLIVIELPENPTTGYLWNEEPDSTGMTALRSSSFIPSQDEIQPDPSTMVLGAPGTRHLEYQVARRGTGRLGLRYWQAWEGEGSIAETFTVTIAAHD
jgi:inhibitor of cysteine peptidase